MKYSKFEFKIPEFSNFKSIISVHPAVQDRVTTETEKSYDRRTTSLGCQMTPLITHINQGKQTTDHQLKVAAE